jgi:hypothetical protein
MFFLLNWFWWFIGAAGTIEADPPNTLPYQTIKIVIKVHESQFITYMDDETTLQDLSDSIYKKYRFKTNSPGINPNTLLKNFSTRLDPPEDLAEWVLYLTLSHRGGSSILERSQTD